MTSECKLEFNIEKVKILINISFGLYVDVSNLSLSPFVRSYKIVSPIVNFINVLRENFMYESLFSRYVLALNKLLYEKHARKTLMKFTPNVCIQ